MIQMIAANVLDARHSAKHFTYESSLILPTTLGQGSHHYHFINEHTQQLRDEIICPKLQFITGKVDPKLSDSGNCS